MKYAKVEKNPELKCCDCGWIGTRDDGKRKYIDDSDFWLTLCPVCKSESFFMNEKEKPSIYCVSE